MLHHDGCYGVPHLSGVVRQKGSLDTHSWQVILMSSISPIRPVINNSISARPTQTDRRTHKHTRTHTLTRPGLQGINEKGNGYISGCLTCLLFRGGVCPPSLALSCALLAATWSVQIVLSPFISTSLAENLKGRDNIHLRRVGADCLKQVLPV